MSKRIVKKHFIYNWLKEDLYGEYTFHKKYNVSIFARTVLGNIWTAFNSYQMRKPLVSLDNVLSKDVEQAFFLNNCFYKKYKLFVNYNNVFKSNFDRSALRFKNITEISGKNVSLMYSAVWGSKLRVIYAQNVNKSNEILGISSDIVSRSQIKPLTDLNLRINDTKAPSIVHKHLIVKKKEAHLFRRMHNARFFNVALPTIYKAVAKKLNAYVLPRIIGSNIASCELTINNVILRSGFFENAYIINNIARRGVFLLNGISSVSGLTRIRVWDTLTVSPQVRWLVIARIKHFLLNCRTRSVNLFEAHVNRKQHSYSFNKKYFLQKLLRKNRSLISLYRRVIQYHFNKKFNNLSLNAKNIFENRWSFMRDFSLSNLKNMSGLVPFSGLLGLPEFSRPKDRKIVVLMPTPAYIEISYKLLQLIVFSTPSNVSSSNLPTSFRVLKAATRGRNIVPHVPHLILKSKY